jgi:hypothetical protein
MSTIELLIKSLEFARVRTLGLLDGIEKEADPQAVLSWRPGPDGKEWFSYRGEAGGKSRGRLCLDPIRFSETGLGPADSSLPHSGDARQQLLAS